MGKTAGRFRRELLPPARNFYQKELGELGRADRKGWATPKAGCPFHPSKSKRSFYVNVITGACCCFGCGFKGDMLGFARQRYGLSFPDAAVYMGALDRDTTSKHLAAVEAQQRKEQRDRDAAAAKREAARRRRIDTRDLLHHLERQHKLSSARLWNLLHGHNQYKTKGKVDSAVALSTSANEENEWELLQLLTVAIAEADAEYCELSGLEFS